MVTGTAAAVLATTAAPEPVPEAFVDLWPVVVRAGWFLAGFLVVFLPGWYGLEPAVSEVVRRRNRNNPTIQEATSRYLRLAVLVLAALVGVSVAGYGGFLNTSALVVAAGTLALGVAGQEVIGSLVSGTVLVLDPEFSIGDYIEWGDRAGTIRSITLRVTRVQTLNGELVTIPNTVLTSEAVTRPYGQGRYRVVEQFGLAYEDDVSAATDLLEAVALDLDPIEDDPNPSAYVERFESDAVGVRVHYWVRNPADRNLVAIRSAYAEAVKDRLEDAGITISPASKRDLRGEIAVDQGSGSERAREDGP